MTFFKTKLFTVIITFSLIVIYLEEENSFNVNRGPDIANECITKQLSEYDFSDDYSLEDLADFIFRNCSTLHGKQFEDALTEFKDFLSSTTSEQDFLKAHDGSDLPEPKYLKDGVAVYSSEN